LAVCLGVDSVGNCYSPGSSIMTDSPAQTIGRPWGVVLKLVGNNTGISFIIAIG